MQITNGFKIPLSAQVSRLPQPEMDADNSGAFAGVVDSLGDPAKPPHAISPRQTMLPGDPDRTGFLARHMPDALSADVPDRTWPVPDAGAPRAPWQTEGQDDAAARVSDKTAMQQEASGPERTTAAQAAQQTALAARDLPDANGMRLENPWHASARPETLSLSDTEAQQARMADALSDMTAAQILQSAALPMSGQGQTALQTDTASLDALVPPTQARPRASSHAESQFLLKQDFLSDVLNDSAKMPLDRPASRSAMSDPPIQGGGTAFRAAQTIQKTAVAPNPQDPLAQAELQAFPGTASVPMQKAPTLVLIGKPDSQPGQVASAGALPVPDHANPVVALRRSTLEMTAKGLGIPALSGAISPAFRHQDDTITSPTETIARPSSAHAPESPPDAPVSQNASSTGQESRRITAGPTNSADLSTDLLQVAALQTASNDLSSIGTARSGLQVAVARFDLPKAGISNASAPSPVSLPQKPSFSTALGDEAAGFVPQDNVETTDQPNRQDGHAPLVAGLPSSDRQMLQSARTARPENDEQTRRRIAESPERPIKSAGPGELSTPVSAARRESAVTTSQIGKPAGSSEPSLTTESGTNTSANLRTNLAKAGSGLEQQSSVPSYPATQAEPTRRGSVSASASRAIEAASSVMRAPPSLQAAFISEPDAIPAAAIKGGAPPTIVYADISPNAGSAPSAPQTGNGGTPLPTLAAPSSKAGTPPPVQDAVSTDMPQASAEPLSLWREAVVQGSIVAGTGGALTTGTGPATVAHQISQVVTQSIKMGVDGPIELTLRPEELGQLRFDISTTGDRLVVILFVERPEAMELIRRHSEQLLNDLRLSGFSQASLSFGEWTQRDGRSGTHVGQSQSPSASRIQANSAEGAPSPQRTIAEGRLDLRL